MSQPTHHLACSNCNNWAHSCVCKKQEDVLHMAPISYHQPSSLDYDEPHPSHSDFTFGSGTLFSPIHPAQFYPNHHSPLVNTSPIANSQQPIWHLSSTKKRKCKSINTASGTPSLKQCLVDKENTILLLQHHLQTQLCQGLAHLADLWIVLMLGILLFLKQHMLNLRYEAQPLQKCCIQCLVVCSTPQNK